jgi:hypothetical protein
MAKLRAWIERLADSRPGLCVLRTGWVAVRIALVGWGLSLLVLMYYAATLGGLFRGSHPREEPWIWLFGIILPIVLTLAALIGFCGFLTAALLRRDRPVVLLGSWAVGAIALAGFLFGMFMNTMGAFS